MNQPATHSALSTQHSALIYNIGQLATPIDEGRPLAGNAQGKLLIISDAAVAIDEAGRIAAVGDSATLQQQPAREYLDAGGRTMLPGWCDAHTHALYAGDRADEFALRLQGASYLEIMTAGGGIMSTVRATRATSDEQLRELTAARLRRMRANGATTVEVKSGYGLSVDEELRGLRILRDLATDPTLPRIVPTFLGAHAVPAEYAGHADDYVALIVEEMLPQVAAEGLAEYCDVFCDVGAFDVAQTRRIMEAATALGLKLRLHANEFADIGAAELAAALGCVSADHLLLLTDAQITRLRDAGCIAVIAPGTPYGLGLDHYAPARRMIAAGLPVALASDCNPGTCPCEAMPLIISLACTQMRLSPAEAIVAATLNGAYALNRTHEVGSIEVGKRADLVLWDMPSYTHLPYRFGSNLAWRVIQP
jgi:imidazolonepropionase